MAQARDSAIVATLVLLCVQLVCTIVNAETYMVGGDKGWTSDVFTWPNGKNFKAGDVLVFMYDRTKNDVAVVDQHGYETCTVTDLGDERYQTGYDEIKLKGGKTFFISSFPGNCESGTKIAINASPTISPAAI